MPKGSVPADFAWVRCCGRSTISHFTACLWWPGKFDFGVVILLDGLLVRTAGRHLSLLPPSQPLGDGFFICLILCWDAFYYLTHGWEKFGPKWHIGTERLQPLGSHPPVTWLWHTATVLCLQKTTEKRSGKKKIREWLVMTKRIVCTYVERS